MEFKLIDSKRIFEGKMIKVWLNRVLYPDGRQVDLEVIHHPGSVGILPLDADGNIWFINQYRHPVGGLLLELPAGTLNQSESPEICAEREIREEIGMAAKTIIRIGSFYIAPGYSSEVMTVFVASDLFQAPLEQDPGEFIEIVQIEVAEAYQMLERGEFMDGKTAAILGIARSRIFA